MLFQNRYPDEAMADILAGTQEVPSCFCDVPCRIAICLHTGDLFWLCSARGCKYVQFSMERPAANDLDLGQFVGLGSAEIDRYTTWTYIMRWFGYSFSSKFFAGWRKIWENFSGKPREARRNFGLRPVFDEILIENGFEMQGECRQNLDFRV